MITLEKKKMKKKNTSLFGLYRVNSFFLEGQLLPDVGIAPGKLVDRASDGLQLPECQIEVLFEVANNAVKTNILRRIVECLCLYMYKKSNHFLVQ